jgi:signal transduction histidine kinase
VRVRIEALLRSPRFQAIGDLGVAGLLATSSIAAIFAGDNMSWGHPQALAVFLALLTTLPVAVRARTPLLAATAVLVGNAACSYLAAPHQAAFQPFVALTLVAFSVGSRYEGPLWAPPVLALAAVPLFVVAVAHGQSPGNAIPNYVWLVAAWSVGRTARSWREKSQALETANRELEAQRVLQAEAAVAVERGRIARELHDVIAHNVSMIVVQAGAAARVLEGAQPHVLEALEAIETTGRDTVDEMRRLLGILREEDAGALLKPQPGLAELDELLANVREAGLPVEVRVEGTATPLPPALDLTAYRIAQEALTNALKHAGSARAQLTLRYEPAAIEIEVSDDGAGTGGGGGTGHGLVGMRERVALRGGRLEAGRADNGWRVHAWLPIET